MCNINLIYNRNKEEDYKINHLLNCISYKSFLGNDDGEGYFSLSNKGLDVARSLKKIVYRNKSYLTATHQRLKTSGYGLKNTQPIENEHFLLLHNGIFYGLGSKKESDSKKYLEILTKYYLKLDKDIIKTIRKLHKDLINGSYSIVLYEKETNKIYYYKDKSTNMYILNDVNYLVLSTCKDNIEFSRQFLKSNAKVKEIKELIIFDLFNGFKKIGTFEDYNLNLKVSCVNKNYYNNSNSSEMNKVCNFEVVRNETKENKEEQEYNKQIKEMFKDLRELNYQVYNYKEGIVYLKIPKRLYSYSILNEIETTIIQDNKDYYKVCFFAYDYVNHKNDCYDLKIKDNVYSSY